MTDLPAGTVTFLFTDIEGSTTRWEQHKAAMQAALARHDAIMRRAIEDQGGVVFKTVGDAFYAAFATASDALDAALAAQHTLQAEAWDAVLGSLQVRMVLHTGTAEVRDGDYFGPTLNRVARLLAAGHGGQILLSLVTYGLLRDALPPAVELRDLGEHRLKDLSSPEHVFQVVTPDLPADFPPLRTLDNRPNNLPMQRTPLVGRERELAAVADLLGRTGVGLVTLTGPGGTGKTRLALQAAANLLDVFADGAWFINLAPISDPELLIPTIAHTLGVRETGAEPLLVRLHTFLHARHLLLLLDNFEQVVVAAPQVAELLHAAPRLTVLITSRVPLHLYDEHEFPVPPLALPDPQRLPPVEQLSQYEAVRLFIQRAQAVKPDFRITHAEASAVAEICVRLDGLPLAIELAAARTKILTPQALLQRLHSRLTLLTGGARDLPARQQTLRNAIDWSYSLLLPAEQQLFSRLAVFVGGRTLEAIEAVCNADADLPIDPFEGITSLVDKSLLRQEAGPEGEPRFVMLETIHEYAWERLEASGDAEMLRRRHAAYFLALSERAEPELAGPEQALWLAKLEAEHDNLRAALQWALKQREAELGLRVAAALSRFWGLRGHLSEGRRWLQAVMERGDTLPAALRAKGLFAVGFLAIYQGDYEVARKSYEASVPLLENVGDKPGVALAYNRLGIVATEYQRDYARARALYQQSMALFRESGDRWGIAVVLGNLGSVAWYQGEYARASELFEESLALFRELGDARNIASVLHDQGSVALEQGHYDRATARFKESLALLKEQENKSDLAACLEGLARVAGIRGQPVPAARLWGAAEAIRASIGTPLTARERETNEGAVTAARAQLDEAAWQAAWSEGRAMALEQAIAYAAEQSG